MPSAGLILQAGPAVAADGNDYPQIATRGEDPAPLSTGELAAVFQGKTSGGVPGGPGLR